MFEIPSAEEALLLEEAWASLIEFVASVRELEAFATEVGMAMRARQPGLAHHPPVPDAVDTLIQARNALRMRPQGVSVQGGDAWLFSALAVALGAHPDALTDLVRDEAGHPETLWFQRIRQLARDGALWPAATEALGVLEGGEPT